jgi:short-subunit dehydrogenase
MKEDADMSSRPDPFEKRYGPWAIVAGASEGVGATIAQQLGQRGVNVMLVARNQSGLDASAAGVAARTRTLALDLTRSDAADALARAADDLEVGLLVYNAGADPYMSPFLDKPVRVWQEMVARNCTTLLGTVHHFAGKMAARGHGGIALMTSGAAWAGGSRLATYGATKAFDLLLAESLWAELAPSGVDVLAMVMGATDTPALRRLIGDRELPGIARSEDVARDLLENLGRGPTFPPGPSPFGTLARREAVQLMSQGATAIKP